MPAMDIHDSDAKELMAYAKNILSTTWNWLTEVMNSIENQLKIGEEFDTQVSDALYAYFVIKLHVVSLHFTLEYNFSHSSLGISSLAARFTYHY